MLGLLYKDFYIIGKYSIQLISVIAVFFIFTVSSGSDLASLFPVYFSMLSTMLLLSNMAMDEQKNWNLYALTQPITRKVLVGSKYILGIIISVVSLVAVLLLIYSASLISGKPLTSDEIYIALISVSTFYIIASFLVPLVYKFGVEKARLAILAICFLPTLIVILSTKLNFSLSILITLSPTTLSIIYVVFITVLYILSFLISSYIVKNKDY